MSFHKMAARIAGADPLQDEEWMETVGQIEDMLEESGIGTDRELQETLDLIAEHVGVDHLWDKWDWSFDPENNYEFKEEPLRQELLDSIVKSIGRTEGKPYSVWLKLDEGFIVLSGTSRDEVIKVLTDTGDVKEFNLENMMGAKGFRPPDS